MWGNRNAIVPKIEAVGNLRPFVGFRFAAKIGEYFSQAAVFLSVGNG